MEVLTFLEAQIWGLGLFSLTLLYAYYVKELGALILYKALSITEYTIAVTQYTMVPYTTEEGW